jgi:hypothetical protein
VGILLCQISTHLIQEREYPDPVGNEYYEKFWEVKRKEGYLRPHHFWELPPWVSLIKGNIPESEFMIVTDVDEFVDYLNTTDHSYICFSVLDCNKYIIKEIIDRYQGNASFAVGGYINLKHFFRNYENVHVFNSISRFTHHVMGRYSPKYDYTPFKGWECIPRLVLSDGCYNKCKFCVVPNNVVERDSEEIHNQINSFKDLKFELVYVNDKTFGQAKNYTLLPKIYELIRTYNKKFRGFIIQTTSKQFLKLSDQFINDAHIRVIEIGIETVNDPILKRYRKPTNVKDAQLAARRLEHLDCGFAPNIIVGMPEETTETYQNTLDYLEQFKDSICHLGICTLAVYEDAELFGEIERHNRKDADELSIEKSFHKNKQVHRWFGHQLYSFGLRVLEAGEANEKGRVL